jgi:hypothetical protein
MNTWNSFSWIRISLTQPYLRPIRKDADEITVSEKTAARGLSFTLSNEFPRSKLRGILNSKERSNLRGIHPDRLKVHPADEYFFLFHKQTTLESLKSVNYDSKGATI